MKKLYTVLLFLAGLFCTSAAYACPTLSGSVTQSSFVSALSACNSGDTLTLSAGTTVGPLTSSVTIPNGVSILGPAVTYSQTPNQTAVVIGSSSFNGPAFVTTAGSATSSIQNIEWNGELPSNGGAFLQIVGGTNNLTVTNNYLHGASGPNPDSGSLSILTGQIRVGSGPGSAASSGIYILNNVFGSATVSDCGAAMNETNTEDSTGGLCNGVVLNGIQNGVYIRNNIFRNLEEGVKLIESTTNHGSSYNSGTCELCYIEYNHFVGIQRIPIEEQSNGVDSAHSTLMYVRYNDFVSRHAGGGGAQGYDISDASGCGNVNANWCIVHTDYNVDIANGTGPSVGLEIWGFCDPSGTPCTTTSYNLIQGNMYNGITWDKSGNLQLNNNTFQQNSIGTSSNQNCTAHAGGYWNWDGADGTVVPAYAPTCTGNTFSTTVSTLTSASPQISPAGGTVTAGSVVTIGTSGTFRDTNTSNWCTTDGSTPAPGSGTSTIMTSWTVPSGGGTLKCLGMWGAFNQPYSYPSGYGYVPSAVQSYTFTTSGGSVTLSSIAITGTNSLIVGGVTSSLTATGTYSNATTGNVTSTATWASSNTAVCTVGATTGIVTAVAAGSCNITATVGAVSSPTYAVTVTAGSIISGYLGTVPQPNINQIIVGNTQAFQAYACYNNGQCSVVVPLSWTIVTNPTYCSVDVNGNVTALSPGAGLTCSVRAALTASINTSQWVMNISSATLTSVNVAVGSSALTVGQTTVASATAIYNNGQSVSVAPTSWSSNNTAVCVVDNSGNVTAVAAGTCGITATFNSVSNSPAAPIVVSAPAATLVSLQATPGYTGTVKAFQFSLGGGYSDGSSGTVANSSVTWTSSNPSVATVDNNGKVTPTGVGGTFITATLGGVSTTATVSIPPNTQSPLNAGSPPLSFFSPNFGCYVFTQLTAGTYSLVVNADGSFTIH